MGAPTAIALSSSPFPKLFGSHFFFDSANLQFSHRIHSTSRIRNPRTTIPHGKLNGGSSGEEPLEDAEKALFNFDFDEEVEDESEEDEETESSVDLLFRFLQSMFKKASKRAKKATRSMLPPAFSPQLVSFAVDGVLLLTLLSVAKALLEVVCTLGGSVFVAVLLLRVIWATASHFQSIANGFNEGGTSYGSAQPVT